MPIIWIFLRSFTAKNVFPSEDPFMDDDENEDVDEDEDEDDNNKGLWPQQQRPPQIPPKNIFFCADAFYKSTCPSVLVFVCLFTFEVPFNGLFAPTSRSRMSNIFRDSESLGKSSGKKWSNIWTFLFGRGLKLPRKKKVFFADFALQNMVETTLPDGLETSGQRAYR